MNDKEKLKREIEKIPDHRVQEVINFVQFLIEKENEQMNLSLVSEPALKKDWLRPEEDDAWKDL